MRRKSSSAIGSAGLSRGYGAFMPVVKRTVSLPAHINEALEREALVTGLGFSGVVAWLRASGSCSAGVSAQSGLGD